MPSTRPTAKAAAPRKPRATKAAAAQPAAGSVTVHPVAGMFLAGVPHVSQTVTAEEAAALLATGAFIGEAIHEPGCDERCDAARGWHYLEGDAPAGERTEPAAQVDDTPTPPAAAGDQPEPPAETASQPDGPASDAAPSDSQES